MPKLTGEEIVKQARHLTKDFQLKCTKFSGAVTTELIKQALSDEGIGTSSRDVYIRGVAIEIDLVIPYPGETPAVGLLYERQQVAVALEIKKMGSFGEGTLQKIKRDFDKLRKLGICCAYITLEERKSFRFRATEENTGGSRCFTLAWHKRHEGPLEDTREWEEFLGFIRRRIAPATTHIQL